MSAGRPVPHHGSGGGQVPRRNDPDETAGRALYRKAAGAEASRSMAAGRKVKLLGETSRLAKP